MQFSLEVTSELLLECRASWHNSCHLKFANSELERVSIKRKLMTLTAKRQVELRQLLSDSVFFVGKLATFTRS